MPNAIGLLLSCPQEMIPGILQRRFAQAMLRAKKASTFRSLRALDYLPDFHGKLFTLPEIVSIVALKGLPGIDWGNTLPTRKDKNRCKVKPKM